MDLHELQQSALGLISDAQTQFHRLPGSAIILRYIKSSYQNDPVRSAVELFLFLFAVRYLLAPKYSTQKQKVVLTEDVRALSRKECSQVELTGELGRKSTSWLRTGPRNPW